MHSFVSEFKLSFAFLSAWQDPILVEISSDFERCSTVLISRILIDHFQVYAYPFPNTKYLYISQLRHGMKEYLQNNAGLEIRKVAHLPQDDEQNQIVFSIQQAIIFHLYHNALDGDFCTFSSEQEYYSLKLLYNISCTSKCIISFERCVLSTPAEGLLYVEFSCYRSKDFELREQQHDQEDDNDLFDMIDAEPVEEVSSYPCKGIFLPECEEVLVLSNVRKTWKDKSLQLISAQQANQQRHGYMQYIPKNKESFQQYWKYTYGIKIPNEFVDIMEIKTEVEQKMVPSVAVIRAIMEWPRSKEVVILPIVDLFNEQLTKCSIFQTYENLQSSLETICNHRKRILEQMSHDGCSETPLASTNSNSSSLFYKASTGRKGNLKTKKDNATLNSEVAEKTNATKKRGRAKKKEKGVAFAVEDQVQLFSANKENIETTVNCPPPVSDVAHTAKEEEFSNIFDTDWL